MKTDALKTIYLKDYQETPFEIIHVDLFFYLNEDVTVVKSKIQMKARSEEQAKMPVVLTGSEMKLISVKVDGNEMPPASYKVEGENLTIAKLPATCLLEIENEIKPQENTSLEGLYKSTSNYYTQCEAEGFRKITYYYDRPDVMATFTTTIEASKKDFPVLLSNGNCIDKGDVDNGRHWAKWEDPFKKPCYLFALVVGDLEVLRSSYKTVSGRDINLEIYAVTKDIKKCDFAMESLINSMKWDEEAFGLECDLDNYMIVAVSDFNMGAMENKGLNIFNTATVLASPEAATDSDYERIESVIGHEYFHNWTGNRITCRDWFQLCLKEGLTVFRDQEFSSYMGSASVNRINMVSMLRSRQFPEDDGPMSHPVRPDSFVEINNFYTATVYEKGAEICRMINSVLGTEGFRKGMDLYIERHDGQAVTIEDFIQVMSDANGVSVAPYLEWYKQAGTPEVLATSEYDESTKTYKLTIEQTCKPTPGQDVKKPLPLPNLMGLIGTDGKEIPLQLEGETKAAGTSRLIIGDQGKQTWTFVNVTSKPVPSLFRGFSAPIKLDAGYSNDDLIFLLANDTDDFNRWNASETLLQSTVLSLVAARSQGKDLVMPAGIVEAFRKIMPDSSLDKSFRALAVSIPSPAMLAQQMKVVDVDGICEVRKFVLEKISEGVKESAWELYRENSNNDAFKYDVESVGQRKLKNRCLAFLRNSGGEEAKTAIIDQLKSATNMTDEYTALVLLSDIDCPERAGASADFYEKWKDDDLVVDSWFSAQVFSKEDKTYDRVLELLKHPEYNSLNPNRVRSLIGAFFQNFEQFHHASGRGYELCADQILVIDGKNPQLASRLARVLAQWKRMDLSRSGLMKAQLERVQNVKELSSDTSEVVAQALK